MRRVLNFVIDLADGILSAVLYSRGSSRLPYTLNELEHQNESKLRAWSAGSPQREADVPVTATEDVQARIRVFRERTRTVKK